MYISFCFGLLDFKLQTSNNTISSFVIQLSKTFYGSITFTRKLYCYFILSSIFGLEKLPVQYLLIKQANPGQPGKYLF